MENYSPKYLIFLYKYFKCLLWMWTLVKYVSWELSLKLFKMQTTNCYFLTFTCIDKYIILQNNFVQNLWVAWTKFCLLYNLWIYSNPVKLPSLDVSQHTGPWFPGWQWQPSLQATVTTNGRARYIEHWTTFCVMCNHFGVRSAVKLWC